jgi:hypothetical protein
MGVSVTEEVRTFDARCESKGSADIRGGGTPSRTSGAQTSSEHPSCSSAVSIALVRYPNSFPSDGRDVAVLMTTSSDSRQVLCHCVLLDAESDPKTTCTRKNEVCDRSSIGLPPGAVWISSDTGTRHRCAALAMSFAKLSILALCTFNELL